MPTAHGTTKRADLVYTDANNQARPLDIMVVGPTTAQALAMGSARKRGAAAASGETIKVRQYGLHRVTPIVMEAGGFPGPAIRQFIKSVLPEDADHSTAIPTAFQAIACALHTVQAQTLLALMRHDARDWTPMTARLYLPDPPCPSLSHQY